MIATVALGLWLMGLNPTGYLAGGWLHAKLTLVAILVGYHFYCGRLLKHFANKTNPARAFVLPLV